jgi:hypothetical protein
MHLNTRTAKTLIAFTACALVGAPWNTSAGAVVIIANRTASAIHFEATPHTPRANDSRPKSEAPLSSQGKLTLDLGTIGSSGHGRVLESGDCISIPLKSSEMLTVRGKGLGSYELRPYSVNYFGSVRGDHIELREIGLEVPAGFAAQRSDDLFGAQGDLSADASAGDDAERRARRTIPVAIYVDDEEPAVDHLWQKRLQDRLAEASKILDRACGMTFEVKSFGKWESNDAINDFELSLREFERGVHPKDGSLAIGFTSQYQITRGRTHLGGTHGPLHSHILLREWSQHVSEAERLELLVHELSHFLGAVHSPEKNSVMRPLLGDRQARARAFRIAIDPVNALAMSVVAQEIRDRGIASFGELSGPARLRLAAVYTTLAKALPDDPAAAAYLQFVSSRAAPR